MMNQMNRRAFLQQVLTVGGVLALLPLLDAKKLLAAPIENKMTDPTHIAKITKSAAEWKQQLDPAAYDVLRKEGTERPFSSPLNSEKHTGTFVCAGCDLPLFTSAQKFDSGTGWPSFFDYIPGHLETKTDYKILVPRTEYHCARCGGHHGHVFKDGPAPTGLRYCNNGVALKFVAA